MGKTVRSKRGLLKRTPPTRPEMPRWSGGAKVLLTHFSHSLFAMTATPQDLFTTLFFLKLKNNILLFVFLLIHVTSYHCHCNSNTNLLSF